MDKRYEEALERAKAGKPIDEVFPELKESEDERIRNKIIGVLEEIQNDEDWCGMNWIPECIAYLEKQKDAIGAARQQGYEEGLEDGIKMNMADQMGESKEWADELSAEIDRISKRYPEVSFAKLSRVAVHFVRWQKDYSKVVEFDHDRKPTNSEKPKEWSEEDNAAYTRILGAVAKAFMGVLPTKPSEEDVHWLKTFPERFNLQPKQEWSEEDERAINDLMWCINAYRKGAFNEMHIELANRAENWLKLLRPQPHWKPSEEQMDALCDLLYTNNPTEECFDNCKSLYEDLKKL